MYVGVLRFHITPVLLFVLWPVMHRFDCGTAAACGAEAVLDFECAAGGVAGEDQLQPLFVAAVVCVWDAFAAVVFRVGCGGAGQRFLLFGGAADVAGAGEEGGCAEKVRARLDWRESGLKRPRGLKPFFTPELYAALKRRSSTVVRAVALDWAAWAVAHGCAAAGLAAGCTDPSPAKTAVLRMTLSSG